VRIVAIINQKGGCGKTTSAINLAGVSARSGLRTLLVDLDPQSHCAAGLAIPEQRIDLDIGDVMLMEPDKPLVASRVLWRTTRNLDLIPSRMTLAGLEAARGGLADKPEPEGRLRQVLARFKGQYDLAVIDCPPGIGLLTYNALAAASDVLIPVETGFFSLHGASRQVQTIKTVGKRAGHIPPYWLVATMHDAESALASELLDEVRRRFGKRVAPCVIRRDARLKEASSVGQPIVDYAPEAMGATDYAALLKWLLSTSPGSSGGASGRGSGLDPDDPSPMPEVIVPPTKSSQPAPGSSPWPEPLPVPMLAGPSPRPNEAAHSDWSLAPLAPPVSPLAPAASIGADPLLTRAEDVAARTRALLLQRADAQLKALASSGPSAIDHALEARLEPKLAPIATPLPAQVPQAYSSSAALSSETRVEPWRGPTPVILEGKPAPASGPESAASAIRAESIRRLLGARATRSGVLFVQPLGLGQRIAIAGDFNHWSETATVMNRNTNLGVHELCIPLPPGSHRYRLVIDGRWGTDPFNPITEPNPFGELNSVLWVESIPAFAAAG
jgi:chromosome partitioning protein